jgi:hypothetical protein
VAAAVGLFAGACGDGEGDGLGVDAGPADAGVEPVRALFQPSAGALPFGAVPWPDDLYLDERGRVSVTDIPAPASARGYVDQLATSLVDLDGFAVWPTVYVSFDGAIDPESLPRDANASLGKGASVFLLDADTGSPTAFDRVPIEARLDSAQERLVLRPTRPLVPARRYAAVVTRRVRAVDGSSVEGARRFVAVRSADVPLSDPIEREARERYAPVLETLAGQGVSRDDVAALAVFHVQGVATDLADLRALVAARPLVAPTVTHVHPSAALDAVLGVARPEAVGFVAGEGAPHQHVGWMVHGTYEVPGLLSAAVGLHGSFERNEAGELRVKQTSPAYFTLILPHTAPGTALPVAIFQHGLGRERSAGLAVANALVGAGYAVFLVDAPFHGLHVPGADIRNRFTGAAGPDGFGDLEGDFAGMRDLDGDLMPLHPFYYRDAARQGVVQLLSLVRVLREAKWSSLLEGADAQLEDVSFASERIAYVGVDLGAALGIMLATVEPSVGALALAFAGGPTLDEWMRSPARSDVFEDLVRRVGGDPARLDGDEDPRWWPTLATWQALVDRADPIAHASRLRGAPVNVLAWMARDDEVVHNHATESLALAIGAELVGASPRHESSLATATLPPGRTLSGNVTVGDDAVTRVLYAWDPATHLTLQLERAEFGYAHPIERPFEKLSEPVAVSNPTAAALTQLVFFLESWRACVPATPMAACAAAVRAPD